MKVVGMKVELMKCKDVECILMCLGRNATHSGQKCHLFRLKRQVGEQLWLRHVVKPGEHQWARGAHVLAGRGKQGIRTQVEHLRR